MIASRAGLALHALALLGILGIGTGLGVAFAIPAGQALQARLQVARAMLDGSALQFQLAALQDRRR